MGFNSAFKGLMSLTRFGDVTTLLLKITVFSDTTLMNAIRLFETSGTCGTVARCHTSEDSNSQMWYFKKGQGQGNFVPAQAMKAYRRRSVAPHILKLGTRWTLVVNFQPRSPHHQVTETSIGLVVSELVQASWRRRNSLAPTRHRALDCSERILVTTLTELSWLRSNRRF